MVTLSRGSRRSAGPAWGSAPLPPDPVAVWALGLDINHWEANCVLDPDIGGTG